MRLERQAVHDLRLLVGPDGAGTESLAQRAFAALVDEHVSFGIEFCRERIEARTLA